jgi:hypothetical protein
MGACEATGRARGKNIKEAWANLIERLNDEFGHQDGYSGQLNCCREFTDITHLYTKQGDRFKVARDSLDKGYAVGWCVREPKENTNKVKSQVTLNSQKGTRKWVTQYLVEDVTGKEVSRHLKQGDAIKSGREYTERTRISTHIFITKQLDSGSSKVASIGYKGSPTESLGEYEFYGMAPC